MTPARALPILAAMCLTCLPLVTPAQGAPREDAAAQLRRARAQMKNLDFESAVTALEDLTQRDLPATTKAGVLLDLGVCHVNLGFQEKAAQAFNSALDLQPNIELPAKAAPKIKTLFANVRDERERLATPSLPSVTPPPATAPAATHRQALRHRPWWRSNIQKWADAG